MATQTLNLNDTIPLEEENPIKALDLGDQTAAKPDRPNDSPNTSTQAPSLQTTSSETVDFGTEGSRKEGEEPKSTVSKVGSGAGNSGAPVTDIQKKIRRAERFGTPMQLSEEEKRSSRAERFGTGSSLNGSDASKKSEELKRKARAERFGLPVPSGPNDEEAKKKARLARFATVSKTGSLEEDKRKARAIRFANPASSSLSQVNGKETIEPKAAIVGKASGGT